MTCIVVGNQVWSTKKWRHTGILDYLVSYSGLIINGRTGKTLIPYSNGIKDYMNVKLGGKNYYVHRLVAIAWKPNPQNKPEVNHLDFNVQNNHGDNLEWSTSSENKKHNRNKFLRKKTEQEIAKEKEDCPF